MTTQPLMDRRSETLRSIVIFGGIFVATIVAITMGICTHLCLSIITWVYTRKLLAYVIACVALTLTVIAVGIERKVLRLACAYVAGVLWLVSISIVLVILATPIQAAAGA